jgi:hypothetical protein
MIFHAPKEMDEFLKPTLLCDCNNIFIKNKAKELTEKSESPKEAALNIFNFVRDKILYGIDFSYVKASDTLKKGFGFCITKTNLQIAFLRSVGIPSRYHQVILSKDVLKDLIPDSLYKKLDAKIWYHPWCECNLSGKWIACDSFLDKSLYEAACKKGIRAKNMIPTINWDGISDLKTASAWIIEDVGIHASYDDVSKKVADEMKLPKFLFQLLMKGPNSFINKVRKA